MFILVALLVTALLPTGFLVWIMGSFSPGVLTLPASYYFNFAAVYRKLLCSFGPCRSLLDLLTVQSMIFSILILVEGFLIRCVRIYPRLSGAVATYGRRPLSSSARWLLDKAITSRMLATRPFCASLWTDLVVIPSLGLLLCLRWIMDLYSSMLSEVSHVHSPADVYLTHRDHTTDHGCTDCLDCARIHLGPFGMF